MLPISLHPENPHYFLFRGRPTVLVTSGEHYGALLNPGFPDEALRSDRPVMATRQICRAKNSLGFRDNVQQMNDLLAYLHTL